MSMYGESPYSEEKNDMYSYIKQFLETHPISELIHIIADVVESEE